MAAKNFLQLLAVVFLLAGIFLIIGGDKEKNFSNNKSVVQQNINKDISQGQTVAEGAAFSEVAPSLSALDSKKKYIPAPADLNVKSALVSVLSDDSISFSLNSYERWPIASLTKLMTAVIVVEKNNKDAKITISDSAINSSGIANDLKAGESYATIDLLRAMLTISSNNAASALAESYGYDAFIKEMNSKAAELDMAQTSFVNPSGLSPQNKSIPGDIKKLISYIYKYHPELLSLTTQKQADIIELNTGTKRTLVNINQFAGNPDFIGGKTGYIDESGGNLASVFSYRGKQVVIIVFGAADRFLETQKLLNWFKKNYSG